jgi:hypothetical protein
MDMQKGCSDGVHLNDGFRSLLRVVDRLRQWFGICSTLRIAGMLVLLLGGL